MKKFFSARTVRITSAASGPVVTAFVFGSLGWYSQGHPRGNLGAIATILVLLSAAWGGRKSAFASTAIAIAALGFLGATPDALLTPALVMTAVTMVVSALKSRADAQKQAQEALESRDEFVSIASHELKTPLTSLLLQIHLITRLLRGQDSGKVEAALTALDRADRQCNRLTQLVNNLLDISRISAQRLHVEVEPTDLARIVRDIVSRLQGQVHLAGCSLEVRIPDAVPGLWDSMRIEQVISNLVSNAVKYGATKPITVELTVDKREVHISVTDQGIGIPKHMQKLIFERFERAVSNREFVGLGLGLYIVRNIVQTLGGRIEVESQVGAGSSFKVSLPRVTTQSSSGLTTSSSSSSNSERGGGGTAQATSAVQGE